MNTKNSQRKKINSPHEPNRFIKRIGSTTFHVEVFFNKNTKETAGDKIERLIKRDTSLGKVVNL